MADKKYPTIYIRHDVREKLERAAKKDQRSLVDEMDFLCSRRLEELKADLGGNQSTPQSAVAG